MDKESQDRKKNDNPKGVKRRMIIKIQLLRLETLVNLDTILSYYLSHHISVSDIQYLIYDI